MCESSGTREGKTCQLGQKRRKGSSDSPQATLRGRTFGTHQRPGQGQAWAASEGLNQLAFAKNLSRDRP